MNTFEVAEHGKRLSKKTVVFLEKLSNQKLRRYS